jgi:predicted ester cyclase
LHANAKKVSMTPETKHAAFDLLQKLTSGDVAGTYAQSARWWGSHPWNERKGHDAIGAVWADLRRALPDMERRDLIFVGGQSYPDARLVPDLSGRSLVATMGHYQGAFKADLCGIPATGGPVSLRFAEVHHVQEGRIVHSYCLWDLLDLMRQAGCWPIAPSLGVESMWPGPIVPDGIRLGETADGATAFQAVMGMHASLGAFDGKSVHSMPQAQYWHPEFMWYGPAGIGTTRGLAGFQAHHQIPFLKAFPDRRGSGHYVRLADGPYVVTGGWPSVTATHLGPFMGLPPTGKLMQMRVMDFYRMDGDLIRENWVPIDVLNLLMQMGVDVLDRVAHRAGRFSTDI